MEKAGKTESKLCSKLLVSTLFGWKQVIMEL